MTKIKRVLLVEGDEDDQYFFLKSINEIDGSIKLDIAGNWFEAVATLVRARVLPDVIFMDLKLPGQDGIECLQQLKDINRFKNIPVVILTAYCGFEEEKLFKNLGASLFLPKPSSIDELKKHISEELVSVA